MLKLITGTPGSGKTLNTIKMIRKETAQPAKVFSLFGSRSAQPVQARPVYYNGIKDLNPEFGWHELSDDEAKKWHDLPSGSIIVFDEAYNLFPNSNGKNVPEHVKLLAVHRHKGFDIYMICQKVTGQIDPFVKGLINEHHHFERVFGSTMVNHFVWGRCESSIDSRASRSDADHRIIALDSSYFGAYKSADVHTHKPRIPVKLAAVVFIALAYFAYAFRDGFSMSKPAPEPVQQTASQALPVVAQGQPHAPIKTDELDPSQYKPRIEGLPWTAPVYDKLRQPKSYPRVAGCMIAKSTNACTCYTQQATVISVPDFYCRGFVTNGVFDDQIADPYRGDGIASFIMGK